MNDRELAKAKAILPSIKEKITFLKNSLAFYNDKRHHINTSGEFMSKEERSIGVSYVDKKKQEIKTELSALNIQKQSIINALSKAKSAEKEERKATFERAFMDVAQEQLSADVFHAILQEALTRIKLNEDD